MRKDVCHALRSARVDRACDQLPLVHAPALADEAALGLARALPEFSAHIVATPRQKIALAVLAIVALAAVASLPDRVWPLLADITSLAFVSGTAFRACLALIAARQPEDEPSPPDVDLPVYLPPHTRDSDRAITGYKNRSDGNPRRQRVAISPQIGQRSAFHLSTRDSLLGHSCRLNLPD